MSFNVFGYLVVIKKDGTTDGSRFAVTNNPIIIGRSFACDIRFSRPNVALKQCAINFLPDGEVYVNNLDCASLPVTIGGNLIENKRILPGQTFAIDTRRFRFEQTEEQRLYQISQLRRRSYEIEQHSKDYEINKKRRHTEAFVRLSSSNNENNPLSTKFQEENVETVSFDATKEKNQVINAENNVQNNIIHQKLNNISDGECKLDINLIQNESKFSMSNISQNCSIPSESNVSKNDDIQNTNYEIENESNKNNHTTLKRLEVDISCVSTRSRKSMLINTENKLGSIKDILNTSEVSAILENHDNSFMNNNESINKINSPNTSNRSTSKISFHAQKSIQFDLEETSELIENNDIANIEVRSDYLISNKNNSDANIHNDSKSSISSEDYQKDDTKLDTETELSVNNNTSSNISKSNLSRISIRLQNNPKYQEDNTLEKIDEVNLVDVFDDKTNENISQDGNSLKIYLHSKSISPQKRNKSQNINNISSRYHEDDNTSEKIEEVNLVDVSDNKINENISLDGNSSKISLHSKNISPQKRNKSQNINNISSRYHEDNTSEKVDEVNLLDVSDNETNMNISQEVNSSQFSIRCKSISPLKRINSENINNIIVRKSFRHKTENISAITEKNISKIDSQNQSENSNISNGNDQLDSTYFEFENQEEIQSINNLQSTSDNIVEMKNLSKDFKNRTEVENLNVKNNSTINNLDVQSRSKRSLRSKNILNNVTNLHSKTDIFETNSPNVSRMSLRSSKQIYDTPNKLNTPSRKLRSRRRTIDTIRYKSKDFVVENVEDIQKVTPSNENISTTKVLRSRQISIDIPNNSAISTNISASNFSPSCSNLVPISEDEKSLSSNISEIMVTPKSSFVAQDKMVPETPFLQNISKNFTSTPKSIIFGNNQNADKSQSNPQVEPIEEEELNGELLTSDRETPKTHVKLEIQELKYQHSTAKKQRKSIKLSTNTSILSQMKKQLFKNDQCESTEEGEDSLKSKRKRRHTNYSCINTGIAKETFPNKNNKSLNDINNVSNLKILRNTSKLKPSQLYSTDDENEMNTEDTSLKLKRKKLAKSSENNLSDIQNNTNLMSSMKVQESLKNDLTDVKDVEKLIPMRKIQTSPKNDLTNVRGVKKLMATPKIQNSPKNDLTNVKGVKKLMSTPKIQNSPKNDLSNVTGVFKLMTTPKIKNDSQNSLITEDVQDLIKTPTSVIKIKIQSLNLSKLQEINDSVPLHDNYSPVEIKKRYSMISPTNFDQLVNTYPIRTYGKSPKKNSPKSLLKSDDNSIKTTVGLSETETPIVDKSHIEKDNEILTKNIENDQFKTHSMRFKRKILNKSDDTSSTKENLIVSPATIDLNVSINLETKKLKKETQMQDQSNNTEKQLQINKVKVTTRSNDNNTEGIVDEQKNLSIENVSSRAIRNRVRNAKQDISNISSKRTLRSKSKTDEDEVIINIEHSSTPLKETQNVQNQISKRRGGRFAKKDNVKLDINNSIQLTPIQIVVNFDERQICDNKDNSLKDKTILINKKIEVTPKKRTRGRNKENISKEFPLNPDVHNMSKITEKTPTKQTRGRYTKRNMEIESKEPSSPNITTKQTRGRNIKRIMEIENINKKSPSSNIDNHSENKKDTLTKRTRGRNIKRNVESEFQKSPLSHNIDNTDENEKIITKRTRGKKGKRSIKFENVNTESPIILNIGDNSGNTEEISTKRIRGRNTKRNMEIENINKEPPVTPNIGDNSGNIEEISTKRIRGRNTKRNMETKIMNKEPPVTPNIGDTSENTTEIPTKRTRGRNTKQNMETEIMNKEPPVTPNIGDTSQNTTEIPTKRTRGRNTKQNMETEIMNKELPVTPNIGDTSENITEIPTKRTRGINTKRTMEIENISKEPLITLNIGDDSEHIEEIFTKRIRGRNIKRNMEIENINKEPPITPNIGDTSENITEISTKRTRGRNTKRNMETENISKEPPITSNIGDDSEHIEEISTKQIRGRNTKRNMKIENINKEPPVTPNISDTSENTIEILTKRTRGRNIKRNMEIENINKEPTVTSNIHGDSENTENIPIKRIRERRHISYDEESHVGKRSHKKIIKCHDDNTKETTVHGTSSGSNRIPEINIPDQNKENNHRIKPSRIIKTKTENSDKQSNALNNQNESDRKKSKTTDKSEEISQKASRRRQILKTDVQNTTNKDEIPKKQVRFVNKNESQSTPVKKDFKKRQKELSPPSPRRSKRVK